MRAERDLLGRFGRLGEVQVGRKSNLAARLVESDPIALSGERSRGELCSRPPERARSRQIRAQIMIIVVVVVGFFGGNSQRRRRPFGAEPEEVVNLDVHQSRRHALY